MPERELDKFETSHKTSLGKIVRGNSLDVLKADVESASVNLIITSPPFALVRKKDYGNVEANQYVDWFKPFGRQFHRVLADKRQSGY